MAEQGLECLSLAAAALRVPQTLLSHSSPQTPGFFNLRWLKSEDQYREVSASTLQGLDGEGGGGHSPAPCLLPKAVVCPEVSVVLGALNVL